MRYRRANLPPYAYPPTIESGERVSRVLSVYLYCAYGRVLIGKNGLGTPVSRYEGMYIVHIPLNAATGGIPACDSADLFSARQDVRSGGDQHRWLLPVPGRRCSRGRGLLQSDPAGRLSLQVRGVHRINHCKRCKATSSQAIQFCQTYNITYSIRLNYRVLRKIALNVNTTSARLRRFVFTASDLTLSEPDRTGQMLNVHAEKLSEASFTAALRSTAERWPGLRLREFTSAESVLTPEQAADPPHYLVFVETEGGAPSERQRRMVRRPGPGRVAGQNGPGQGGRTLARPKSGATRTGGSTAGQNSEAE